MGKSKQLKATKNPPKEYIQTKADQFQQDREKILLDKSRDTKIKTKFKPQIIGNDEEEDDYLSENEQDDEDIELLEERETEPQDEESDSEEEEEVFEGAWSGDEDTESSEEEKDELSKQKWSGKDFHLTKQKKPKKETFNESKEEENEAIQLKKKRNQRITKNDVFDDTLQEAFEKQKESSEENESEEESEFKKATELTKEEKLEQIMKESPEMIELVADLKEKLKTIKEHLLPLIKKIKNKELVTKDGLSYLEVKFQLLLNYCIDIVFYLLLKSSGKSVKDHPVISQLVELRVIMEKIRPIDERLKYQINKLVSLATSQETSNVELDHRPNPQNMMEDDEEDEEEQEESGKKRDSNVYVAPKLMAVSYDEGSRNKLAKKKEKLEKKLNNSKIIQTLKDTIGEEPDFDYSVGAEFTKKKTKEDELLRDIEEYENENFTRVSLNKKQKNMLKKKQATLIPDELQEISDMNELKDLDKFLKQNEEAKEDRVTLLQYSSEKAAKKALKITDEEPVVESKREKKRKHREEQQKQNESEEEYQDLEPVAKKKKRREEEYKMLNGGDADEKRSASNEIVANRGLVIKRKKEDKNPRLKLKHKFEKKTQSLPQMRKNPGAYSGEKSIEKNVVKSKKIKA